MAGPWHAGRPCSTARDSDRSPRAPSPYGRSMGGSGRNRIRPQARGLGQAERAARGFVSTRRSSSPNRAETEAIENDRRPSPQIRSEEHTSELQSLMRISYAVFCLKKKKNKKT